MKGVVAAAPQPFVFFSHHSYDSHIIIIPTSQSQISVFKTQQHQHRPTPLICLSSFSSFFSSVVEQQREDSLPLPSPSSVIDSVDDDPDALPVRYSSPISIFLSFQFFVLGFKFNLILIPT